MTFTDKATLDAYQKLTENPPVSRPLGIQVEVQVTWRTVADLMVSAFETASAYWARSVRPVLPSEMTDNLGFWNGDGIWYDEPWLWEYFGATIVHDGPDSDEGAADVTTVIDADRIKKGLALMAAGSPKRFSDITSDNADANTADVFLQYVVLGEVIFG